MNLKGFKPINKKVEIKKGKVTTLPLQLESISDDIVVESLSVSPKSISLKANEKKQLKVKAVFSDKSEKDVTLSSEGTTYKSSNGKVISVSKDGEISIAKTAKKGAKATITVSHMGRTAKCTVTIK